MVLVALPSILVSRRMYTNPEFPFSSCDARSPLYTLTNRIYAGETAAPDPFVVSTVTENPGVDEYLDPPGVAARRLDWADSDNRTCDACLNFSMQVEVLTFDPVPGIAKGISPAVIDTPVHKGCG